MTDEGTKALIMGFLDLNQELIQVLTAVTLPLSGLEDANLNLDQIINVKLRWGDVLQMRELVARSQETRGAASDHVQGRLF
jgi:hypothetical protein